MVRPFYEIVRRECGLPALAEAVVENPGGSFDSLPELEIIKAPKFVTHRFERLKERKSLSVHFYPFHEPNALVTDPAQRIEIFIRMIPQIQFAAVIGERLDLSVNPAELYLQLALMLREHNVTYVEIINDAADPWGELSAFCGLALCRVVIFRRSKRLPSAKCGGTTSCSPEPLKNYFLRTPSVPR